MKKYLSVLLFILFFVCCQNKWDETLLLGNWTTVEWVESRTEAKFDNTMDFEFSPDGRYKVDYGSLEEKGKYWISGDFLHTIEDKEAEKKVRILNLNSDSLVIEMNRSGRIEKVTLIRP